MFRILFTTIITLVCITLNYGQANTLIKVEGPDGALVLSNQSGVQRNAMAEPENGMLIMNSTTGCLNYYFSGQWFELCGIAIPTCSNSSNCLSGEICVDGTCVIDPNTCETTEDCPEGMICVEGQCQNI